MYDTQRWSQKSESLIPHIIYSKIVRSGWLFSNFIRVPANNAKPLNLLLEGSGKKGR